MVAAISFVMLYLVHIVLMAQAMHAINGRLVLGAFLGLCAAAAGGAWLATVLGLAALPTDMTEPLLGLCVLVSGTPFYMTYMTVRPRYDTLADADSRRILWERRSTGIILAALIGLPVVGIVVCAWFLLFKKGDFFRAR